MSNKLLWSSPKNTISIHQHVYYLLNPIYSSMLPSVPYIQNMYQFPLVHICVLLCVCVFLT